MKSALIVFIVAVSVFLCFQFGILERPPFVHQTAFLGSHEMLAIMATTRQYDIGKHVLRLKEGSERAVSVLENHESMLQAAAALYKVENKTSSVGVGLYFDDPFGPDHPRWAVGWAVEGPSYRKLKALIPKMQQASGLSSDINPIRVVRVGGKGVETFTARVPWRNLFTPMIAPMLHWGRGFEVHQEYVKAHTIDPKESSLPPIALEVYVTGENNAYEFIDYTVLFGATENTWDDSFPGSSTEETLRVSTATK